MARRRKCRRQYKKQIDEDDDDETYLEASKNEIPFRMDKQANEQQSSLGSTTITPSNQQQEPVPMVTPISSEPEPVKSKTSIKSTPVNRKRSHNRRRSVNRTMNVTNLNILFDSSYINQNSTPQGPENGSKTDSNTFINPESTPSRRNVDDENNSIMETPKISQFALLDEFVQQLKSPSFKSGSQRKPSLETLFMRLKRYSKTSVRWSQKLVDFCNSIGASLKKTFSGICNAYPIDKLPSLQISSCQCVEYKHELGELQTKVEELRTDLFNAKTELDKYKQNDLKIALLTHELAGIRNELNEMKDLKNQVQLIREHVQTQQQQKQNTVIVTQQPLPAVVAPPVPPPPPPPPPPPLLLLQTNNTLKITKRENSSCNKENSRPIISLDDILKVKLKKPAERSSSLRRSTEPTISTEMLKQVKLKPASRPQTPTVIYSDSTSPRSSLTRLLSDNNSTKPDDGETGKRADDVQLGAGVLGCLEKEVKRDLLI